MTKDQIKEVILSNVISVMSTKKGLIAQIRVDEIVDNLYDELNKSN